MDEFSCLPRFQSHCQLNATYLSTYICARADVKIQDSYARALSQTIKAAINIKIDGAARKMKIARISIKTSTHNGLV